MFVVSMKASKRRWIPMILCVTLIAAMLIASLCFPASRTMMTAATVMGADDEDCAAFLKTLGYTAVLPAAATEEIQLPDRFDDALTRYNSLQQQAGFNLADYAGQRVKYRTYDLTDHPDGLSAQAHIYVYNDRIIGGDITATDGSSVSPLYKIASIDC